MENRIFGYVKSELDGTEYKFEGPETLSVPESYSYKEFLPDVLDQGALSICVPCSLTAHVNWNINVESLENNTSDHAVQVMDIYNIRTNPGEGMSFKEALHYLYKHGVETNRGNRKIDRYAMVRNAIDLKKAIIMNGPCVGALPVYDSSEVEFWKRKSTFEGGHAISIVGYTKDGFIIRNSWGKEYGADGYSILKYSDFHYFYELWTIID